MNNDLERLLADEGLADLTAILTGQGVDLATFADITDDDLKGIGVEKLGDRKRLLKAAEKVRGPPAPTGAPAPLPPRDPNPYFTEKVGGTQVSVSQVEVVVAGRQIPIASVWGWGMAASGGLSLGARFIAGLLLALIAWLFYSMNSMIMVGFAVFAGLTLAVFFVQKYRLAIWVGANEIVLVQSTRIREIQVFEDALGKAFEGLPGKGVACTSCRTVAPAVRRTPGVDPIAIGLFIFGFFSWGLGWVLAAIYAIRAFNTLSRLGPPLCGTCGSPKIVPILSVEGRKIMMEAGS